MDDGKRDQYKHLKEVLESFDTTGVGSLCPEELSDLCRALHLEDATPTLLHALLQNQDRLTSRADFDQVKNALYLVLSTTVAAPPSSQETLAQPQPQPDSSVQPKFMCGSKRYGRRSKPEFILPIADCSEVSSGQDPEYHEDSTVLRKRERWNVDESSTDEYEADGQLHPWNPDDPSTPRVSIVPLSDRLEDKLRQACEELAMPWDGCASHHELLALCDHLGLEVTEDVLQVLNGDEIMSVEGFASWVLNHTKPPTPFASTPYRRLKRLHSSQLFDETGRRTRCMTSTIRMCLFSTLDDGTGSTPAEDVLGAWMEEGIENSPAILQALNFDLKGKVNLGNLTVALEEEFLKNKNGILQAALASFKAEIRYLLELVDRECREKEKIRSDLEKAEKLKTQLAIEVDEHHSAIEHMNDLNLWKLKQEHREKLASVQSKHIKEMDQIQQQAGLQREELEAEMEKIRDDKTCLRESLSLTVKERSRLEMELLDSTEKLVKAESQVRKLQSNLDNILEEKFGDLDPGSAEFFFQEERLRQLRSSYEEQCRELQDRIDELQAELQEYHNLGRTSQLCLKPSLSEELESKSPGMESDPGLGSEKGQPLFNMSLEAEIMLEQLKEKHLRDMEDLQAQLESKVSEFDQKVEEQKADLEAQKAALSLQYMEEIHALQGEMASSQNQALELKAWLEQAEEERACLEQRQAGEREELENQQDEEVSGLKQELLEAHTQAADLEEQLKVLEEQLKGLEERHAVELNKLDEEHKEILLTRMEEERGKLQEARAEVERRLSAEVERRLSAEVERRLSAEVERRLSAEWERKKVELQQTHEETVKARIEDVRLMEEGERKKAQLDKQSNELLQTTLEEAMLRLVKEQEKEARLTEQWELERARLQQCHEAALLTRLAEGRLKQQEETERRLREDWDRERLQLEEDYEGMLQEQLQQERERLAGEKEEVEKRLEQMIEEEKERLKEAHRQAMQEVSAKHSEEREQISRLLDQLLEDISDKSLKLEHFRKEKISAQKKAESFKRQISALCLRGQQLEDENGLLSEKNAQNAAGLEGLSQQLGELLRQSERQEAVRDQQRTVVPEDDRTKMAVCVSALEAELTSAVEGTVLLQQDKAQLLLQLNTLRDKTQLLEESLQSVNLQSARLKSDLRLSQQEKDALKQEVMTLHKQLQNGNDKNQVLEMALHSSRYQSQHRKLYRDELARLVEQEKLKQEIERLTIELHNAKGDHHHTREKDERAMMMMMMKMEERMREIELSLHDVKLLLKEKVCQLKDQRHKNGKADLLIKDLYVENGQLLEALEMTEQRQKVAEKKNYLLEEKISSLNKIVRDLSPSPLPPMSYHLTRS